MSCQKCPCSSCMTEILGSLHIYHMNVTILKMTVRLENTYNKVYNLRKEVHKRMQTELANSIDVTVSKARYDSACKKLLSDKQILAWILKCTVKEYQDCEIKDIIEKYIEGTPEVAEVLVSPGETNSNITGMNSEDTVFNEGKITYDIRFQAVYPKSNEYIKLFINVEAQSKFYPGYPIPKRGIFYCSRMLSSQYATEFEAQHYENIKKVYSIWICMNPPKKAANTITRYYMEKENVVGAKEDKPEDYDLLSVIMICLGGENLGNYGGVLKLLDILLSEEKTPETRKEMIKRDYGIIMTQDMEKEVNSMCNLSEGLIEKGIEKGARKTAENMLRDGMEIEKIMKYTGLTREEVNEIKRGINL